jgi:hypothetical protein
MCSRLYLTIAALLSGITLTVAATRCSVSSGQWHHASTWAGGVIPGCGDSVIIFPAHTISVSVQLTYEKCQSPLKISVGGQMYFVGGKKLKLSAGSAVYILPGGIMNSDGSGNSNLVDICDEGVWSSKMVPLYGPYVLKSSIPECAPGVLPVEPTYFRASLAANGTGNFNWETVTELHNDRFEVEILINNEFVSLATVPTKAEYGNSNKRLQYELANIELPAGVSYCRLKQVDVDQSFSYSKIVVINKPQLSCNILVSPNPATSFISVDMGDCSETYPAKIHVRSATGKSVLESQFQKKGTYNIETLEPGLYFLELSGGGHSQIQKLLVYR